MAANTILDNMKRSTKMFTDGFVKWDVDLMLAPRSEDCMYTVRPKSMGFPPADNQAFRQFVEGTLMKVLQDTKVCRSLTHTSF